MRAGLLRAPTARFKKQFELTVDTVKLVEKDDVSTIQPDRGNNRRPIFRSKDAPDRTPCRHGEDEGLRIRLVRITACWPAICA